MRKKKDYSKKLPHLEHFIFDCATKKGKKDARNITIKSGISYLGNFWDSFGYL